jgi:hypothetical protein
MYVGIWQLPDCIIHPLEPFAASQEHKIDSWLNPFSLRVATMVAWFTIKASIADIIAVGTRDFQTSFIESSDLCTNELHAI